MAELTYEKAIKNVAALKKLGQTDIFLHGKDVPWHIADKCQPEGTHRMDMATSVWFSGTEKGLRFRWSFDIEPLSASGKGSYEIDVDACRKVIRSLKGKALGDFQQYLADCAAKVKARGKEFQAAAERQFSDAMTLESLSMFEG